MLKFILNNEDIETDISGGTTVLDFVRYHKDLKGTKIGCREGDCGACVVLVGELVDGQVRYRSMTSCLMPLANAAGKHILTIEGVSPEDGSLSAVQRAVCEESGTQCGFCTPGFVMSLTGFCLSGGDKSRETAISLMDGNICRCTGYKSLERAAETIAAACAVGDKAGPAYLNEMPLRLERLDDGLAGQQSDGVDLVVGGGTDLYVQRPDELPELDSSHRFYDRSLRSIFEHGEHVELGASVTVTDMLESELLRSIFPKLYDHLKLVSSTPIRNMATLAGNFVNASPIGDMTVWFLALNAEITLSSGRIMLLRQLYVDYKKLAKQPDEHIVAVRFKKPFSDFRFNFEKVSKRTYLDIATVNTAASFRVEPVPGQNWMPPAIERRRTPRGELSLDYFVTDAHVAVGGVAPVPLYLKETSSFLIGRHIDAETFKKANDIMQAEISPISDVRGSEKYKRLLAKQLFRAHFVELFET